MTNFEDSLRANGQIENVECEFVIDTGSNITIVRPDVIKKAAAEEKIIPVESCLRTVTGETSPVTGRARLNFRIGVFEGTQEVWVADIADPCILGLDFMMTHNCQVDMAGATLKIGSQTVPLLRPSNRAIPRCCRVVASESVNIPPRSESIIYGTLKGEVAEPWGSIGPVRNTVGRRDILVGGTLVDLRSPKGLPVRVMNVSNRVQRVERGTEVASYEAVECAISGEEELDGKPVGNNGAVPEHLVDLYERSSKNLTEDQGNQLKELLVEFQDVFSKSKDDLGRTGLAKHKIDVGNCSPIRQPIRVPPLAKREEAAKAIHEMNEQGIIEPSSSPWASPVVLVRKKDGSTRFCVDYRKLNAVTKKDSYPLPRVDTSLHSFHGSIWFSTLDLKSGYWQVEMSEEDKEKTAFTTGQGLWQFVVMPFGLSNAPATFERLMELVLVGLPWTVCLVYLDDIIVHAQSFQEELRRLRAVFDRLRSAKLKLNAKKCLLFQHEVNYLGHTIGRNGIATDSSKVEAVEKWPVPRNCAELRSFLGLCSYYRRFVKSFAEIASPLHKLCSKGVMFEWTEDCQAAWDLLKSRLTSTPILSYPCPENEFILDTDASNNGIGAVLSQVQDNEERVIGYYSRTLNKAEKNYCVTRKELLAAVAAVEHFNYFLYGRKFIIRTDHSALQWLINFRNIQGQLARWLQKLQQYDFTVVHRPGSRHQNADALSRRPCLATECPYCSKIDEGRETRGIVEEQCNKHRVCTTSLSESVYLSDEETATFCDIRNEQMEDEEIGPILNWLGASCERPDWSVVAPYSRTTKILWAQWDSLRIHGNSLCRLWEGAVVSASRFQLIVPKKLRTEVLQQLHGSSTSGHFGVNKTLQRLKQRFYWPQCRVDVKHWCEKCDMCASKKGPPRKSKAPLKLYTVGAPMERIAIDVMGPLPITKRGNKYLLVAMDYFTKWPEAYPLPNQEARTVATVLVREFVCRFGTPLELHADQGRNFESAVIKDMCGILGIHKTRTTPYHPESDGMVERSNRTFATQLSMFVSENQSDWDEHVDTVLMAYRTAVHESTGQTPAMLMMGHELRIPIDLLYGKPPDEATLCKSEYAYELAESLERAHSFARNKLRLSSERMKRQYDRDSSKCRFERLDNVWLYTPRKKKGLSAKFQRFWSGPYVVVKRINDLVYKIQAGPRCKPTIVHRNRLRKYSGPCVQTWLMEPGQAHRESLQGSAEIQQPDENNAEMNEDPEREDTDDLPLRRSGRKRRPPDKLEM